MNRPRAAIRTEMDRPRTALRFGLIVGLLGVTLAFAGCRRHAVPTKSESILVSSEQHLLRAQRYLTELDVNRARTELETVTAHSLDVALLRARLALAVGDCQGALVMLSTFAAEASLPVPTPAASDSASEPPTAGSSPSSESMPLSELKRVADGCARAMAGAALTSDDSRGVWVRFQNPHDRVLLPLIADAADRAAQAIGQHLGTALPRPLRIELVADLPSLAAVTGLPLDAAERTGTIAIARWGKVTMVSPRATPDGFPWQDTLAHELTHLIVTRQSADAAPLWLQEGIAKREESRWRPSLPLDAREEAHREARAALIEGRAIGLDQLGASIAFMPTPRAAETAYAEVSDFLDYWIGQNGQAALILLLRELGWLSDPASQIPSNAIVEHALVSVSGYSLRGWLQRWQRSLLDEAENAGRALAEDRDSSRPNLGPDSASRLRMAELLEARGYWRVASEQLPHLPNGSRILPELGQLAALAQLMLGNPSAALPHVDPPANVSHLDGTWLAVRGRTLSVMGRESEAEIAFQQSLAFAPTLERVACRGFSVTESESISSATVLPRVEPWLSLCRAARSGNIENSQ